MNKGTKFASDLSPEFPILGMLFQESAHGYELYQRLKVLNNTWHISLGQIYNILNRLETKGYILSSIEDQDKLPARRHFTITNKGRERFMAWLEKPTASSVRALRIEFLTRLFFARDIIPKKIDKIVEQQIEVVQVRIALLKNDYSIITPEKVLNRMGLDFRIKQMETVLLWITEWKLIINNARK